MQITQLAVGGADVQQLGHLMWWRAVTAVDMRVQPQTWQACGGACYSMASVLLRSSQHGGYLSGPMSVDLYIPCFLWDIICLGLVSVCVCGMVQACVTVSSGMALSGLSAP